MKTTNLPAGSDRQSEVGLVWVEQFAAGLGAFEVQPQGSVRVYAVAGPVTIEIAGIPALTLETGEKEIINVGTGTPDDQKRTVTFEVTAGSANVSVALENERGRRRN